MSIGFYRVTRVQANSPHLLPVELVAAAPRRTRPTYGFYWFLPVEFVDAAPRRAPANYDFYLLLQVELVAAASRRAHAICGV